MMKTQKNELPKSKKTQNATTTKQKIKANDINHKTVDTHVQHQTTTTRVMNNSISTSGAKYFPKIDFFNDKVDILWNKQMDRITLEKKLLGINTDNSSIDLQKTFYKGDIFFKKGNQTQINNQSSHGNTNISRNISLYPQELSINKSLSKDRLRDFHSERVRYLGESKGYMNAFSKTITFNQASIENKAFNKTFCESKDVNNITKGNINGFKTSSNLDKFKNNDLKSTTNLNEIYKSSNFLNRNLNLDKYNRNNQTDKKATIDFTKSQPDLNKINNNKNKIEDNNTKIKNEIKDNSFKKLILSNTKDGTSSNVNFNIKSTKNTNSMSTSNNNFKKLFSLNENSKPLNSKENTISRDNRKSRNDNQAIDLNLKNNYTKTIATVTIDLEQLDERTRIAKNISPMHRKLYESSMQIDEVSIPKSHPSYDKNIEKQKKMDSCFKKKQEFFSSSIKIN